MYGNYTDLLRDGSTKKNIVISFDNSEFADLVNSDIKAESLAITKSIVSGNTMQFGSCESAEFKISLFYDERSYVGKNITVSMYLDGNPLNTIPLGRYKIVSDKPDGQRQIREIVAYDMLHFLQETNVAEWYKNLVYPISLKNFCQSMLDYVGLPYVPANLPNDEMLVEKTIDTDELFASEVLKAVCELNGVFGQINRQGKFEFVSLSSNNIDITAHDISSAQYEDFITDEITGVVIRQEENDIGASYGFETNPYIVENNFLVYGKDSSTLYGIAQNMFGKIQGITYRPFNADMWSLALDLGDKVTIHSPNKDIESYVFAITTTGIQNLKDNISNNTEKSQDKRVVGVRHDIQQLKGKSNVLERSIEQTRQTITNVEAGLQSEIIQTADMLNVRIEQLAKDINKEIETYNLPYNPTLENYPANTFTYNIPVNNTVQLRDDLRFEYTEEYYNRNARTIFFNTETSETFRFEKRNDVWNWYPVADTEYTYVLQQLADLKITAEGLSSEISTLSETVSSDYIKTSDARSLISQSSTEILQSVSNTYVTKTTADGFETKQESETKYQQTSEAIRLEASRASSAEGNLGGRISLLSDSLSLEVSARQNLGADVYGKLELKIGRDENNQIVSMLNASANQIDIKGDRIRIQSNYFKLDYDGKIVATGGTIGGWTISGSGIEKQAENNRIVLQSDGSFVNYDNNGNLVWALTKDGGAILPGKADVGDLNAVSARVGSLEADHVSVSTFNATKATVDTINANYLTANTITADIIQSKFQSPSAGYMTMGTMRASNLYIFDGRDYRRLILGANGIVQWS